MEEQLFTALINELALKLGGTVVIVSGLTAFLGTLYVNRQREKNRKETEKHIHIYKAQFEKEFSSYQEIWKLINDTHSKLGALMRSVNLGKSIEISRKECRESLYALQSITNEIVPFIDKSIEDIMFETTNIYSQIHLSICTFLDGNKPKDLEVIKAKSIITEKDILNKHSDSYKKCAHNLEKLSKAIQDRISSLSVNE